jgi:pyridoxal phosphate enzyme (YggS family)
VALKPEPGTWDNPPVLTVTDQTRLADNLQRIRDRIASACASVGRDPEGVTLVAVTKYAGVAFARGLLAAGQRDLGENRVDHLLTLAEGLSDADPAPRWHMIGHLQRNKAKKVAAVLHSLHSLDSLPLATRLNELRPAESAPLEVYLQLKLGDGEARSGIAPDDVPSFVAGLTDLTRLRLVGLMGLPPIGEPEDARPHFQRLAAQRAVVSGAELALSMGMTSDLEVAIAEGSTCVRVGRALLEGLDPEALQ